MEWTAWETDYYKRHMEDDLKGAMQKAGLEGDTRIYKAMRGEREIDLYRCLCKEEGFLLPSVCLQDLQKICEGSEEELEPSEILESQCEGWAEDCRFMADNRERLFQREITEFLFPVLMNTEMNVELLKEMPHVEKGEFSVALNLAVPTGEKSGTVLLVSNQMLESWGMELETALEMAINNPWFLNQCSSVSNSEIMRRVNQQIEKEWCGMFQIVEPEPERERGYIIHGDHVSCHAAILNQKFAEKFHEKMGEDYLVAFSGNGEIQIFRDGGDIEELQLEFKMDYEAFGYTWDWVSGQIYRYTKERGLEEALAADSVEKEKVQPLVPALKR